MRRLSWTPENAAEAHLAKYAVIHQAKRAAFLRETRAFIKDVPAFVDALRKRSLLPPLRQWRRAAATLNRELPSFDQLTKAILRDVQAFDAGRLTGQDLNRRMHALIRRLDRLPEIKQIKGA
jgi:hypothetical protein